MFPIQGHSAVRNAASAGSGSLVLELSWANSEVHKMESRNTRLLLSSLKCSYKARISDRNSEGGHKLENI